VCDSSCSRLLLYVVKGVNHKKIPRYFYAVFSAPHKVDSLKRKYIRRQSTQIQYTHLSRK
jgi:hypothetical protein